jgi:hypothetical protein
MAASDNGIVCWGQDVPTLQARFSQFRFVVENALLVIVVLVAGFGSLPLAIGIT